MILITGATGFLGAELVTQLLGTEERVRCLKLASSMVPDILQHRNIDWVEADILDQYALEQAFSGVTEVYHCAAMISFKSGDKDKLHRANAVGTANIVNLSLQMNIRKLVHVSSVATIGETRAGQPADESTYWEFSGRQSGYAISKYEAEMEVWRGIAEGLNAVIVNPSVIIGENSGHNGSGQIFLEVKNGLKFYTPGSLGIVDVRDVAAAMILLMKSPVSNERFILNSVTLEFKDLLARIAAGYGLPAPSVQMNALAMQLAWRGTKLLSLITGKSYALTREIAAGFFKRHEYVNTKFLQAFPGFEYRPVEESIQAGCRSCR